MLLFWVVLGIALLVAELFLPALVAGSVGVAALIVAGLTALNMPIVFQFVIWVGLSILFTLWSRRLVPKDSAALEESREARSLTSIPAGEQGRVAYLGSTWNARCTVPTLEIPEGQALYVVERQGNTLLVMPLKLLESKIDPI